MLLWSVPEQRSSIPNRQRAVIGLVHPISTAVPQAVWRQPWAGCFQALPKPEALELLPYLITNRLEAFLLSLVDAVQNGLKEAYRASAPQHHQTLSFTFSAWHVEGQHQPVLLFLASSGFVPLATGSDFQMPVLPNQLTDFMGAQTVDANNPHQQHQAGPVGIPKRGRADCPDRWASQVASTCPQWVCRQYRSTPAGHLFPEASNGCRNQIP